MNWLDSRIDDLARQLAYTPVTKRREQLANTRALLSDIDPEEDYTWEFVRFRITGYRPREEADHRLVGKVLLADLPALIEYLSTTMDIPANEAAEEVLSLQQVTARFKVSTKTIQRWRRRGLVAMRYLCADGIRRIGFLPSDVSRFAEANRDRVANSARFRQLTAADKEQIIRRARRLSVKCHCCIKEISKRIARHLGRSPESVRTILREFDARNPEQALFTAPASPLTETDRRIILDCADRGISVECIARRYCRTRHAIEQVVTEEKARRVREIPIPFVTNQLFDMPDAQNIILNVLPGQALKEVATATTGPSDELWTRVPPEVPVCVADAFDQPIVPQPLVIDAFRRMNFLKAMASRLQAQLDIHKAKCDDLKRIEDLLAQAGEIRNQLLQSHLRMVVYVARQHVQSNENLFELISDGNLWLMRAVECFDFSRGVKFSTYLTYALMKNYARRFSQRAGRSDGKLVFAQDDLLDQLDTGEQTSVSDAVDMLMMQGRLVDALAQLPKRERDLVASHYGLEAGQSPASFSMLAERMGVTKARVRQLETRAIRRLRKILNVEIPSHPPMPAGESVAEHHDADESLRGAVLASTGAADSHDADFPEVPADLTDEAAAQMLPD